jgi:hypothetical protein
MSLIYNKNNKGPNTDPWGTPVLTRPASNYSPISLLRCIGKVMERAVYKYTYNFIFEHSLLYAYQSGFIRANSVKSF